MIVLAAILRYIYVNYLAVNNYQLLNVLPCSMQCYLGKVGMLPETSADGNIPTKGEQHACYVI